MTQIGPPNSLFLKSKDKTTWSAKDVADSFLADKSAVVFAPVSLNLCVHVLFVLVLFYQKLTVRAAVGTYTMIINWSLPSLIKHL